MTTDAWNNFRHQSQRRRYRIERQVLIILEAMKMENEIMAPADGTVTSFKYKGASVNAGDVLIVLG